MVVSLLAAGLLLAAAPPVPFTDCELGQRFGPTAVTFACNDAADVFECPKAESGGACTDALCGGAHSHVGCSCSNCRQRSATRAASSNFTCACIASSGCACQIAPPLPPSSGDLPYLALFKTGEEGFPCTRFPMMLTAWGKIHAVSEFDAITGDHCGHGSDNAHATGRIAVKTSVDAKTWSAPSYLPLGPLAYARDPTVLFIEKIGRLCVFFDAELRSAVPRGSGNGGDSCGNDGACSIYRQCHTGETGEWEAPVSLKPHLDSVCAGFIQGRPVGVVLPSGRVLMTTWRASFGFGESQICVIASDDGAQTWKRVALIENVSEAALALLPDKQTVYLNARHTGQENGPKPWGRVTGYSTNEGINWDLEYNSSHSPIDTASPSPTSLLLLPDGQLLMALPTVGYHSALRIFSSSDDGRSWPKSVLVSAGLCYHPSLVAIPGDSKAVGVAWEAEAPGTNCSGSCMVRFSRVLLKDLTADGPRLKTTDEDGR